MAEEFNIVLEYLKKFDKRQEEMVKELAQTNERLLTQSQHSAAAMGHLTLHDTEFAELKDRLARVEKQLGLIDDPH